MQPIYVRRQPVMKCVRTYQPKRLKWRWYRCKPLVAIATVAVVSVMALMMGAWLFG